MTLIIVLIAAIPSQPALNAVRAGYPTHRCIHPK
jgi:hypothetical protein